MKIIGITGNSGSGKSTVCEIIKENYNAKIIDADKVAKSLTTPDTEYFKDIINTFGKSILDENKRLNRKKLADIVFNSKEKKLLLDKLTFKYVVEEIKREIKNVQNYDYILLDVPLLFESNLDEICDLTIGVIASEDVKIKRIMQRDNISLEKAKSRLNSQSKEEFYIKNCDYIINNKEKLNEIINQINKIFKTLQ